MRPNWNTECRHNRRLFRAAVFLWAGLAWWLAEMEGKPEKDAMVELKEQRAIWDRLIETSLKRA